MSRSGCWIHKTQIINLVIKNIELKYKWRLRESLIGHKVAKDKPPNSFFNSWPWGENETKEMNQRRKPSQPIMWCTESIIDAHTVWQGAAPLLSFLRGANNKLSELRIKLRWFSLKSFSCILSALVSKLNYLMFLVYWRQIFLLQFSFLNDLIPSYCMYLFIEKSSGEVKDFTQIYIF